VLAAWRPPAFASDKPLNSGDPERKNWPGALASLRGPVAAKPLVLEFKTWPSPKTTGRACLFDTLGLERKKSLQDKKRASHDAAVLEKLAGPITRCAALVWEQPHLEQAQKHLVDALPALVEPETGAFTPTSTRAVTATTGSSSSHPNLQNIPNPARSSGRRIRKPSCPRRLSLISADYSRSSLRSAPTLRPKRVLLEAYRQRRHVHALTPACYSTKPR